MPLIVRTMEGLGDNLWSRPVVRALAACNDPLILETTWPQCYTDFEDDYGVRFQRPSTRLRTQQENIRKYRGWSSPGRPAFRLAYDPHEIAAGSNHHDSLERSASQWLGTGVSPLDIRLRIPAAWLDRADALLEGWSQINGPVVLVRPGTVRAEWRCPARNCDPHALNLLVDRLRPDHTLVSVAHLVDRVEWLVEPAPNVHVRKHRGEIPVEAMLALVSRVWSIGVNGFLLPMALAVNGQCFLLFGGHYGYNAPDRLLHPGYDLSRLGWVEPDEPCRGCINHVHNCNRAINPDRLIATFDAWVAGQDKSEKNMGSVLRTHAFGEAYYHEHRQAGLDYLGHGEWQRRYGRWLASVFEWQGKRVLDVGCACGSIVKGFRDATVEMYGIDVNEFMVRKGREKWPELAPRLGICDAVNMHLFPDEFFDGLHSAQVAEHWKTDLAPYILKECLRVLKPGGFFFCCMDTLELYERQGRDPATEDPTHYSILPRRWWRHAFHSAGWEWAGPEIARRLAAHAQSMLVGSSSPEPHYDWDFFIMRKPVA